MTPREFTEALVRSKALDVPAAGAKARALASIEGALATGAGAAAGAGAGAGARAAVSSWMKVALVAAAAAGGAAAADYGARRALDQGARSSPAATAPIDHATATTETEGARRSSPASAGASTNANADANASGEDARAPAAATCAGSTLPEKPPARCSTAGRQVWMELSNKCSDATIDMYWVNYACREVYRGRLPPGGVFRQMTSEGHPWRLRDHATGKLVKEFAAQAVPGAPDLPFGGDAGVMAEDPAPVVVRDDTRPLPDGPPAQCSGAAYGARGRIRVTNDRRDPIVLMWVGHDCLEQFKKQIAPGATYQQGTYEGDAWRVRASSGDLLGEIAPAAPDTTTYVTVP